MRIEAVLFDLDGTLLDRRETFRCHLYLQFQRTSKPTFQKSAPRPPNLMPTMQALRRAGVDVAGARASGLLGVWKKDTFWTEPSDCDWVIDDLGELLSIVGLVA